MISLPKNLKNQAFNIIANFNELQFRLRALDAVKELECTQRRQIERLIKNGNSAGGYIPFISGQTELIIYNFFSQNYGARRNIDIITACVDIKGRIRVAHHIFLNHRSVLWSFPHSRLGGDGITNGILVVIAVSPHIPVNHGSHCGHLRFWGIWNNSCIVHSMPRNFNLMPAIKRFNSYDRMMHSKLASQIIYISGIDEQQFLPNGDVSGIRQARKLGYNIQLNDSQRPSSIHHCSPLSRTDRIKKRDFNGIDRKMAYQNIVAIPPLKGLDVEMYFGEICSPNSYYRCHLEVIDKNNVIRTVYYSDLTVTGETPIKLSSIFKDFVSGDCVWIRFEPLEGEFADHYINVTYISRQNQTFLDSVHSHNYTIAQPKTTRSLKFAPFMETSQLVYSNDVVYESILAIWGAAETPTAARLRVLSVDEPTLETVHNVIIPAGVVQYFSGAEMIKQLCLDQEASSAQKLNSKVDSKFIVQLESEENNLAANIYIAAFDEMMNLKSVACDHLTGG